MTVTFPTAAEFRAWLEAKPADEVIAERWDSYTCPLARCLESRGATMPRVSPWTGWALHSGSFDQYLAVPFWALILWRPLIPPSMMPSPPPNASRCCDGVALEAFSDG